MNNARPQPRSIFLEAIALDSPAHRASLLDQRCGNDFQLRADVERLLASHDQIGTFQGDVMSSQATADQQAEERPGVIIGPYKLLQQIGEGGMGAVFMAEQVQPVRRFVALKIIKPGMDTRQVTSRFEAERQALALMDHPNIAKVLDAGATESDRPYFAMELVKGVPITKYCDEKQLPIRDRLELFLPVCQAVQHAHQKGVIHRDIKPTNVLVAEYDDHAVPKIIDFGVAKATAQKLTERTMFTEFGQVIGTVEYMSPEQAKLNQLDIDTRSDVYSLGVLLYELLTGSTPFEQKRLREAGFDEVLRIIRDEEPPKPSTKLHMSETLPSIAANRHTEQAKLSNEVRGDLDWIVMKALEKNRNRRYETASELSSDIRRHLSGEAVLACPPSTAYRLRRFVSRHRAALATAATIAATLFAATIVSAGAALRATRAQAQAEAATAREAKLFHDAELHVKTTQAQALFLTGDLKDAEALLRELPDNFVEREARLVSPLFRALAHWHGGAKRWRQSAEYYKALLYGPARQSAEFYDNFTYATVPPVGPTALISPPWSLVYFEFAPLLIELDDRPGYKRLCESGTARYAESTIPNQCEIMMHVVLLEPPDASQMATISRWAKVVEVNRWPTGFMAIAMWHYRQGEDEMALAWCRKCLAAKPYPGLIARVHVLQAMAYSRLNDNEEAVRELALGRSMIDSKFQGALGVGDYAGDLWADWLMNRILLREAEATLNSEIARDNPNASSGTVAAAKRKIAKQDPASQLTARMNGGHQLRHLAFSVPWKGTMGVMAEATFRAAADVIKSVTVEAPTHWEAWHYLADTHRRLGDVYAANGDFAKAETEFRRAVELFSQHAAAFDSHPVNVAERGDAYFELAALLAGAERSAEALKYFRQGCAVLETHLTSHPADQQTINGLAWRLAASAEPLRDPVRAVELAQKAVAIQRSNGVYWNTLGVARYYAGQSEEAIEALEKSMERQSGGDPHDWLFLAMAHWKLGHREEAGRWYDRSVEWMEADAGPTEELERFRAETAKLLRIGVAESTNEDAATNQNNQSEPSESLPTVSSR